MATMKAVRVNQFGGPEVLQIEEVPVPTPSKHQVQVKIYSTGINPVETYIRSGNYPVVPSLPYTPGQEGAGEVTSIGEGVTSVKVGDRVWVSGALTGTYAQYTLAELKNVHHLDEKLSFDQGAALWVAYATAYHALHHIGQAKDGYKILVHGASGGVGTAALQWARQLKGSYVAGTAGTEPGLELIKKYGAVAYNHRQEGYLQQAFQESKSGFDIILEMLANVNLGKDLPVLATNGRVCVIGNRGTVEINPRDLMTRRSSVHGVVLGKTTQEEKDEIVDKIEATMKEGKIHPQIGKAYELQQVQDAHKEIINPPQDGALGKLILRPWE